jgi:hypothetical protein
MSPPRQSAPISKLPPPNNGGHLPGVLTLRDVRDVESLVAAHVQELGVQPGDEDHTKLVLAGVQTAYRVERALPPERPLRPVLELLLEHRLAPERSRRRRTAAAAQAGDDLAAAA